MTENPDGNRRPVEIVRATIALAVLALGSFLAYGAYRLLPLARHVPAGWPAVYTEHLLIIGGVAFEPSVLIAAVSILAALAFALGVYLLASEGE